MNSPKPIHLFLVVVFLGLSGIPTALYSGAKASIMQTEPPLFEGRTLVLDYPSYIRYGDTDSVRLTFEAEALGKPGSPQPQATTPDVYRAYTVLAEARLEMAGAAISPPSTVSEPLLPGETASFFWSVLPRDVGPLHGTVWFYLHFIPKNGGPETRRALSAQPVEINSDTLFGLQAGAARWLGIGGTFFSALLAIPFVEGALKWLSNRLQRKEA